MPKDVLEPEILEPKRDMQFHIVNAFIDLPWQFKTNYMGKLYFAAISMLDFTKRIGDGEVHLCYSKVCELLDIARQGEKRHNIIQAALVGLREKSLVISIKEAKIYTVTGWINDGKVNVDEDYIKITISRELEPLITTLQDGILRGYVQDNVAHLMNFKSSYSIHFYLLVMKNSVVATRFNQEKGEWLGWCPSLDEIFSVLCVPKSYKWITFRDFILDKCIEDINSSTNLNVWYEPIYGKKAGKGRNPVVGVRIMARIKVAEIEKTEKKVQPGEQDSKNELVKRLERYGVNKGKINEFIGFYDLMFLNNVVDEFEKVDMPDRKPTKPGAYLTTKIKNSLAQYNAINEQKKLEAEKKAKKERQKAEAQAELERQQIAAAEQAEARQKENDDIVSRLSPDQKARIVELLKNDNHAVAMAIKGRAFDDLYQMPAYSGMLMFVYRKHFAEQPNLWDETVDINELAK